jgi:hypothetical protein
MSETPVDDAFESDREAIPPVRTPTGLTDAPVEADEADAAEQALDVPIDEDEYR